MQTIVYYVIAQNEAGQSELMMVIRGTRNEVGAWTGVVYATRRDAELDAQVRNARTERGDWS